jgi:gluconate 2-dehydrogenase gamma chain
LINIAASAATVGLTAAEAQHVHEAAALQTNSAGGPYKPKGLNQHEYDTLKTLCDLIIPRSVGGGAPQFIDLLCANNQELQTIYTGGIAWLDSQMNRRNSSNFVESKPEQQTAMLDLIAFRRNSTPDLAPGILFFDWVRKMSADAYYTSAAGMKELGFMGNKGMAKFQVPVEAIDYAVKRSGLS